MTLQEKSDLVDSFPDFSLRGLYKVLFDPRLIRQMQEYGGNPQLREHDGKEVDKEGNVYHIWEAE